jgi:hypothetical protein
MMAQPKAQTIQQRFGFMDNDLKSPIHDTIMLWLDSNVENIVKKMFDWSDQWDTSQITELEERVQNLISEEIVNIQRKIDELQKDKQETEEKINEGGMLLRFSYHSYIADYEESLKSYNQKIEFLSGWNGLGTAPVRPFNLHKHWEYPVKSDKFIVGFIDMLVLYHTYWLNVTNIIDLERYKLHPDIYTKGLPSYSVSKNISSTPICFEVKGTMPALGELIRQINMYRTYQQANYYIVSSEDTFIDLLNSQGIGFIKYPSGEIYKPK